MAVPEVLSALAEQWERIDPLLDPASRTELRGLIIELASVGDQDEPGRRRVQSAIALLVLSGLPANDPLGALRSDRLSTGTGPRQLPSAVAAALLAKLTGRDPLSARQRILGAPWETAIDLRSRGVEPDLPHLIRLDHAEGSYAVPNFQFDESGAAIPVVLRVNEVLDARDDPWGAADWWLSVNVWLADRPSNLVDSPTPDILVAAAVAAVEG